MGRSAIFTVDALLDAAREVVVTNGLRGTTVSAIAQHAGAPVGSIYHRFESLDDLLTAVRLRSVAAMQHVHSTVETAGLAPVDAAAEVAVAIYDYCVANPKDALLLERIGPHDVAGFQLSERRLDEIAASNREARRQVAFMAQELFGRVDARSVDAVVLALVDLPVSFARRYLHARTEPPTYRRAQLPLAVRAILTAGP